MTSATSAPSRDNVPRGFTLTEMLVAMGILVLLAGLLLPMIIKSYSSANKARTAADLQAIAVALDAYKQDFGTYPLVNQEDLDRDNFLDPGEDLNLNGELDSEWGAAVLAKTLIGPGGVANDATAWAAATDYLAGGLARQGANPDDVFVAIQPSLGQTIPDVDFWRRFVAADGFDGPGFKVGRRSNGVDGNPLTTDDVVQGRTYGPYLQPDRFKLADMSILDRQRQPILYFPVLPRRPDISTAPNHVNRSPTSLYDADDNLIQFQQGGTAAQGLQRVRAMLGDINNDGAIGAGETAVTTENYLLWSAGNDLKFGTTSATPTSSDVSQCDDVTNFR